MDRLIHGARVEMCMITSYVLGLIEYERMFSVLVLGAADPVGLDTDVHLIAAEVSATGDCAP